jgi:hypothetical protein
MKFCNSSITYTEAGGTSVQARNTRAFNTFCILFPSNKSAPVLCALAANTICNHVNIFGNNLFDFSLLV